MTVAQQARDAAAIIKAMGSDKSLIFGSSGGAIIGLELAAVKPEVIDFLIFHEAPLIEPLPTADAEKWLSFHHDIYMKSLNEGWKAALPDFITFLVGTPNIPYPPDLDERVSGNMDFFFKHEYLQFIQFIPDIKRIRENKVNMVAAIGRDSDDAHYVQSTRALVSKLGCECVEFPGQHDVSFYMPEEFAKVVRSTLERSKQGLKDL